MIATVNPRVSSDLSKGYKTFYNPYSPRGATSLVFEHIKVYYSLVESFPRNLMLVMDRRDLRECLNGTRTGFLLSLEGSEALDDTDDIRILYNCGLRNLGFNWNYDTRYSASCMSKKDYGLTGEGEALLKEMNKLGVIADLAHASKKTCTEVLASSKMPAIVSHANVKVLFDCARNLDEEVMEALKANGGVMGFIFAKQMMGGRRNVNELVRHILYVYRHFGPDIMAIGTDYFGLGDERAPDGLEDVTRIRNLWGILMDKGVKEADIAKIAYQNALRVIEKNATRWR